MGHVTLTMALLVWFVIRMLGLDIAYWCKNLITLALAVPEIWLVPSKI